MVKLWPAMVKGPRRWSTFWSVTVDVVWGWAAFWGGSPQAGESMAEAISTRETDFAILMW